MGDGIGVGVGHGGFSGSSGDGHGVGETVGDGVGVCWTLDALTSVSISLKLLPIARNAITRIGSISVLTRSDLIINLPGLDLSVFRFVPPEKWNRQLPFPQAITFLLPITYRKHQIIASCFILHLKEDLYAIQQAKYQRSEC